MKSIIPNRINNAKKSPEEELCERQDFMEKLAKVIHSVIKHISPLIAEMPDPRDQSKIKYKKESLLLYGIMSSVMHVTSRRNANQVMTAPIMRANLESVIPDYAAPHGDTLANWLERIDPESIQDIYCTLIKRLFRSKEFLNLVGDFKILIDGSGKYSRDWQFSEKALHRKTASRNQGVTYMSYVVNAVLVLENGMVIPLITEFLDNSVQAEFNKQDCEIKAWKRLAPKLRKLLGHRKVIIIADSLYANEPFIKLCNKYHWEYVVTLKDGSMPVVVADAEGLMCAEPGNRLDIEGDGRAQIIQWANGVEKLSSDGHHYIKVNIIRMTESWTEEHPITGKKPETHITRYQWLSSKEINAENAEKICFFGRRRWLTENNYKTEKHSGYQFEHVFSYDWQAGKGYHYLMTFGHFINVMILCSEIMLDFIFKIGTGISGLIKYMRLIFNGYPLDGQSVRISAKSPFLWRFNHKNYYRCLKL